MSEVYRHYELLEMDDATKRLFLSIAGKFKYVTDLMRAMEKADCKTSRPTTDRLLTGFGNKESIDKVKKFIDSQIS